MKLKSIAVIIGIILISLTNSCAKKVMSVSSSISYSPPDIICMGIEHDGSQTLKVWGKGSTKADAIEQAKKNAVYAVLFDGIRASGPCERRPLVPEVNARERYARYFNPFFADGGEYKRFVKEDVPKDATRMESKGQISQNYGIIVTVDREGVRQQLEKDGILPFGTSH